MCGRFTLMTELELIIAWFGLQATEYSYTPRYNIAPGQPIPAIIAAAGSERRIGPLRWGLVPSWAADASIGARIINARAETLAEKPAFRKSAASKRCVIPADGYYEWRSADKQPFRIAPRDKSLLAMAAVYDTWVGPDGTKLHTCAIITTEASEQVAACHHRMPAMLDREGTATWLDRSITDIGRLMPLLTPTDHIELDMYPVSRRVGNVKHDDPACIERIGE